MKRHPLWRFMGYVHPHSTTIMLTLVSGLLKFLLPLTMAVSVRFLTDRIARAPGAPDDTDWSFRFTERFLIWFSGVLPWRIDPDSPWGLFNLLMVTLTLTYLIWGFSLYFRAYLAQKVQQQVILDLRVALYSHILRMSHNFFLERQSGSIVSRLVADISLSQTLVGNALTNLWMDTVTCGFVVALLWSMDRPMTLVSLAILPAYIYGMRRYGQVSRATTRSVQQALEELSGRVQERVSGHSLIKSFCAEEQEKDLFRRDAIRLRDLSMHHVHATSAAQAITQWLTQMGSLILVWYAGYRLMTGNVSIGTVVAFLMLVAQMYQPLNRIGEQSTVLHTALAAIERIFEMFDIPPDLSDRPEARDPGNIRGAIDLEDVTFAYPDGRPVLCNINLSISPGEIIALVGPSGAGKTSFIQLVPRFYDVQQGSVRIDGIDVRDLQLRALRRHIGIVSQEILLFAGTIRDNLLYARPEATPEQLEEAARAADAHNFVCALPHGYDSVIGERGVRLSGGQRQRLAIARAFLADPKILILDEATSALDSESEALVQEALARLMKGRTCLVIAHRLATIRKADRIVVMEAGRIVEVGNHASLLQAEGLYARLCQAQGFLFSE
ncbi:ABC transporter ATP-binding protein [bacterium]|nr:ABC transporter ATP-binding protein [bacterium]